ncbi:MAG: hypothetical protein NC402_04050 [Prevotella sp.]|nr:hypothetical protein [Prevotella sp.]MCM1074224.1 hypothetical protein [Ruminococcus sp.]
MDAKTATANTANTANTVTTMFNLIILDESGSMSCVRNQTLSGCNELINTIKSTQEVNKEKIRSLVSIYAFQSSGSAPSRYIVKNAKPEDVQHLTERDYTPWGGTPLLDAVGSTLSELKAVAETHDDCTGTITVMTDGYENASCMYTWQKVAKLISWFKELGWTVNLVGANVDVMAMAKQMNIDSANAMAYNQTDEGVGNMWHDYNMATQRAIQEEVECCCMPQEERVEARKLRSSRFWKK